MLFIDPLLIKTHEKFKKAFLINEAVLSAMVENMKAHGFDRAFPLIVWKEKGVLVDGHTRRQAAIKAGIPRVPYVLESFGTEADVIAYMRRAQLDTRLRAAIAAQVARVPYVLESFGTEADVIAYMRRAQLDRRNLTDADKIHILLNDPEYPRASNKKAYIASVFRCSVRTAAKYSRIMNSPEELKAVLAVSESDEPFIMKKQARTDTDAYITYAKRLLKVLPDKIDGVERKLLIQELKLRLSRLLRG